MSSKQSEETITNVNVGANIYEAENPITVDGEQDLDSLAVNSRDKSPAKGVLR